MIAHILSSVKEKGGILISLTEKIKSLCSSHNLTIAELERKLGLGNGSIARWDRIEPGVIKVRKVADYFGVTLDELTKEKDK